jgi:hypothetical protein
MPRAYRFQTNFSAGVLDPRLAARTDIKSFYEGVDTGKNVLATPQGGLKRRPGMAYIDDIGEDAILASFEYSTIQTYLLVFTENNIAIYRDDVWQADVTTTFTAAELADIRWTQTADTMIIVHENHNPQKLVRGATHSSWTLSNITFNELPVYDFDQDYGAITFTIGTGAEDATVVGNSVTCTADAPIFTAGDVNGKFTGKYGAGKITGYTSTTVVTLEVTTAWPSAISNVEGGADSRLEEPAWSAARGWPKTATFHEARLAFGGSTDLPQTVWLSRANDFFNFNLGTGLDDEAIFATADTDQVNAMNGLFSGRHFQMFTTGGEFYSPDSPMTPSNFAMRRQSDYGSNGLKPLAIDGPTIFMDRTGKSLREFSYTYIEEAYVATTLSMVAPHLISAPVAMVARRGASGDEANYVYLVNDDGTMAVLNTLRSEGIAAWTQWETAGEILHAVSVVDDLYFLVKRTINSVTEYYLEKADENTFTDCNIRQTITPSVTVTGLAHLNGEECRVKADGAVMANNTPSAGSITVEREVTDVEVGLNFDPLVKTMPLNIDYANGPILARDKRISKVQIDLYESLGVYIDGILLPDRDFGETLLDRTPDPYTGLRETFLMGWTEIAQVEITQQDPVPMMILALSLEVEA